ncbi:MAG: alpha/beta fold hydrolase, partial [Prolixibacteraceae bacterium]|nr:alpha/beta fold hydrolase [Burkholderiales bacterium]
IRKILASVLRTEPDRIDPKRTLSALGVDSLMAIEIKMKLELLGVGISVTQLLNRSSVASLAKTVLDTLGYGGDNQEDDTVNETAGLANDSGLPMPGSWLVNYAPRPLARLRMICFPYAGGGPGVYRRWSDQFAETVEIFAINLPGRGDRVDEGYLEAIGHAADAIIPELLPLLDRPFALFGHCMGAILMYEVAQRLQMINHPAAHIFASGCMAPHLYNSPLVHEQPDAEFLDVLRLISFSSTRALIEDGELRRSMFPLLRADFKAVVEYGGKFQMRPPLTAPITGLAADNDLFAAPKAMEAWGLYTSAYYELAQLPGDHYFVESDVASVTAIVRSRLAQHDASLFDIDATRLPSNINWRTQTPMSLGVVPLLPPALARPANTLNDISKKASSDGEKSDVTVFCFPSAFLTATEFTENFAQGTSDIGSITLQTIDWRGDGSAVSQSIETMVERAYQAVTGKMTSSTVFYGHCLGALVAYELARRLEREGLPVPVHLVMAGTVGPHLYVAPNAHQLSVDKLLELLDVIKYPYIKRLKADLTFRESRLDMIRADFEAMATYQHQLGEASGIPLTAISLRHDLWSYPLRTDTWQHHTSEFFDLQEWEGDHYACNHQPQRLVKLLETLA